MVHTVTYQHNEFPWPFPSSTFVVLVVPRHGLAPGCAALELLVSDVDPIKQTLGAKCNVQMIVNPRWSTIRVVDHLEFLSHLGPPLTNHMISVEINVDLQLTLLSTYHHRHHLLHPPPLRPTAAHAGKPPMARMCMKEAQATVYCCLGPRYFFLYFFLFTYLLNNAFITAYQQPPSMLPSSCLYHPWLDRAWKRPKRPFTRRYLFFLVLFYLLTNVFITAQPCKAWISSVYGGDVAIYVRVIARIELLHNSTRSKSFVFGCLN